VGDRLVSRCDDGLLEAEFALFDRSEVLLSPGLREEGYMTSAGLARRRLNARLVTIDLANEAFAAMRGRHSRRLARSAAVREVIDQLGPYETFQGGRFVAGRGRYTGLWLDLDALAAECPLRNASVVFQALHLALVLEEVGLEAPVRLLTSQAGREATTEGRTWRHVDLESAQRLPWVLREMQAPARSHGGAHDEAEVREQILRDLRARATGAAVAQPRLGTLAAAIARTGGSLPPDGGPDPAPTTRRMSSWPARRPDGSAAHPDVPRPSARAPSGPPPVPMDLRLLGEMLEAAPKPNDPIHPAPVIVLSGGEDRKGPPRASPQPRVAHEPPAAAVATPLPPAPSQPVVAAVTAIVQRPTSTQDTALAVRIASSPPADGAPFGDRLDPRLVLLVDPDSQRSAGFRLLRDNLLAKKAPRIIAVSSGAVHEGKTTCAINLAIALSEKPSTRVLLMEGNFFEPSLGGIFHIDATVEPDPQVNLPLLAPYRITQRLRGLHVAALVQQAGEAAPAFNSRWFGMVIDHLSGAGYDHLVIDAAALDGSPAVTQLVGVADGTLLTVRSHSSTARSLRRAAEQIPEGRALGITLMDSDS